MKKSVGLGHLNDQIIQCHESKEYRPNVKIVVRNLRGETLFTMSPLALEDQQLNWSLPGGGINLEESLRAATERELKEEAGILPHQIIFPDNFYLGQYLSDGRPKEGFTKGKIHFCVQVIFLGNHILDPNIHTLNFDQVEVGRYAWVKSSDVPKMLATMRQSSRASLSVIFSDLEILTPETAQL